MWVNLWKISEWVKQVFIFFCGGSHAVFCICFMGHSRVSPDQNVKFCRIKRRSWVLWGEKYFQNYVCHLNELLNIIAGEGYSWFLLHKLFYKRVREVYTQCTWKTLMIHQTFVRWALYVLFKFVKSDIWAYSSEMSDVSDDFHEHCTLVQLHVSMAPFVYKCIVLAAYA